MKALILVDLQNDFMNGGALAVKEAEVTVKVANELMSSFQIVVATQDYHPVNHGSFASQHEGKVPGDMTELAGLAQVMWPDHCVEGTVGADFHKDLDMGGVTKVFQKGRDPLVDSYSGFYDNERRNSTGLTAWLKEQNVEDVYVMGVATDYCVKFTALDAVIDGFKTNLIVDGSRGVNLQPGDVDKALIEMKEKGIELVESNQLT